MVIKKIGEGNFSKVQLAYHVITKQRYALKLVNKQSFKDLQEITDQIKNEVTLLRGIQGNARNFFVKLEEFFETDNLFCMVMEYCEGGDLFTRVSSHQMLKEDDAREYFVQIVFAVKTLHELGICHRDLKLENFLLDGYDRIKLADFGLSKAFVLQNESMAANLMSTYCGTTDYAAPEILRNLEYDGRFTDIWSIGVVLFSMLSGCFPFRNVQNQMNAQFHFPPSMSPLARDLLTKILVVKPQDRLPLDKVLEHPWCAKALFLILPPATRSTTPQKSYSISNLLSDPGALIGHGHHKSASVSDFATVTGVPGKTPSPILTLVKSESEEIRPRSTSSPNQRPVTMIVTSTSSSSSTIPAPPAIPPPPPPPPLSTKFLSFVHDSQKFFSRGKSDDGHS